MPRNKFNHTDCSKKVCFLCFLKKKTLRNITDKSYLLIRKHLVTDNSLGLLEDSLSWLPSVICTSCLTNLNRLDKDPSTTFKTVDYSSLTPPQEKRNERVTRAEGLETDIPCSCSVCVVGHMDNSGKQYIKYTLQMTKMKDEGAKICSSAVRCEYCLSPIGKGKSHPCTERDRRENINDLISGSSNITKERVLSSQLKEWTEEQGVSRGKEISLSTGGK